MKKIKKKKKNEISYSRKVFFFFFFVELHLRVHNDHVLWVSIIHAVVDISCTPTQKK